MKYYILLMASAFLSAPIHLSAQKTVEYDLVVRDTVVNITGKKAKAISLNGQIPAPTLHFTEGDTAIIRVHNRASSETTLHWHGLIVPNEEDGVPYLTTEPTPPGKTHTYKFPIVQNGTYFYHSHSGLQQQVGVYGAFIINKKPNDPHMRDIDKLPTHNVVLSEWTNTNPNEVMRRLKTGSDWGEIKKGSVQSYGEALTSGNLGIKLTNEWKRMSAMDVSDVYYDKFLVNGKGAENLSQYKAGDKVRLRVINAGSSSYFWIQYAGGKMEVVPNDGKDVVPVKVDRLILGVSETYDVVVTIPKDGMSYEFLATPEDRTGSASIWLGEGMKMTVKPYEKLKYFAGMKMMNDMMDMSGNMKKSDMPMSLQKMDMNEVMYPEMEGKASMDHSQHGTTPAKEDHSMHMDMEKNDAHSAHDHSKMNHEEMDHSKMNHDKKDELVTLNYSMLKSPYKTTLPADKPVREMRFELTGNMNRYVWTIDNKTVSESDKILIKKGENIRIVLYNNSMMRHPMHLHGHFFRVLNGQGDYSPLKTVLDIMPMETDTIEFHASEEYGDWFFHCHILYHMMSGMNKIFSYEGGQANPQVPDPAMAMKMVNMDDQMFYLSAQNLFQYNGNIGKFDYSNTRWAVQGEWQAGYQKKHGYEGGLRFGRYVDKMQWFMPYIGAEWKYGHGNEKNIFGQVQTNHRFVATAGIRYTLPMLFVADANVNMYGKARVQLEREDIPLTSRIRMDLMVNTDKEYRAGLRYILTPYMGVSVNYSNEMKLGAGLAITY